jgi:copper chaperone CopZ
MEGDGIDDVKIPLLQSSTDENVVVRTVTFQISDIKCASCVNSIESALKNLNGVRSIAVSSLDGRAAVKFVPKLITVSNTIIIDISIIRFKYAFNSYKYLIILFFSTCNIFKFFSFCKYITLFALGIAILGSTLRRAKLIL